MFPPTQLQETGWVKELVQILFFLLLLMGVAVTRSSVSLQAPTIDMLEESWWPYTVCSWRYCVWGRYPGWDFSIKCFCKKHILHWNVFACIEILFFKTEFDLTLSWPTLPKLARIWVEVLTIWIHEFSSNLSCSLFLLYFLNYFCLKLTPRINNTNFFCSN